MWRPLADNSQARDVAARLDESKSHWEETMVTRRTQRWMARYVNADLADRSESQHHSIGRGCKLTGNSPRGRLDVPCDVHVGSIFTILACICSSYAYVHG